MSRDGSLVGVATGNTTGPKHPTNRMLLSGIAHGRLAAILVAAGALLRYIQRGFIVPARSRHGWSVPVAIDENGKGRIDRRDFSRRRIATATFLSESRHPYAVVTLSATYRFWNDRAAL